MVEEQGGRSAHQAAGVVAIILAVSVGLALNVITGAILYAAYLRLGVDVNAGISENGTQLLTGAFGGIIGALSAYLGYALGRRKANGENESTEPDHARPNLD